MNTLEELVSIYNIHESNAKMMLNNYSKRIGQVNGDYTITDITYKGFERREVEITCNKCDKVVVKSLVNGKNKWSELAKKCDCGNAVFKNSEKIKKALRNDDDYFLEKAYGTLVVKGFSRVQHKNKSGSTVNWECVCSECGAKRIVVPANVKSGKVTCPCQRDIKANKRDEHIGKKYNRLTIIDFTHNQTGKVKSLYAVCQCDCGNIKEIQPYFVLNGTVKSCGCLAKEIQEEQRQAESKAKSPLYSTWNGMKQRCGNKNSPSYADYGGRGITVCDEWSGKDGFDNFESWSIQNGYRPKMGLSLDRIDVNKGYSPENCRWTSIWVQSVNKRVPAHKKSPVYRGKLYTINGVTKNKKEWCEEYGVWSATIDYRMKKMGMSFEEALVAEKANEGNHNPKILDVSKRKKTELERLNKINSYIECNLYMKFISTTTKYELEPQYKIGDYKVDFWVKGTSIVVECDGYDYHKTKEQISYDCKRQRYLTKEGYDVVRFSGTEINTDCEHCVKELIEVIESRCLNNEQERATNF